MDLKGLDALMGALKDKANLNDVKNVVKMNGSEMQRNMQRDAPVDTGFLKRHIIYRADDGGFTARVASQAEYSIYLIYGTRFNYMQDFFRPNYFNQRQKFLEDLKRLMR